MVLSLASSAMAAPSPTVRDEDIVHNGSPQYLAYNDATRDGKKAELRQLGKFCYEQFIANEENMDRFMDGVNKLAEDVKDDGVGIPASRCKTLLNENDNENENRSEFFREIGISNVHKRLQYEFGENYGLFIESEENSFTNIRVTIPERREDV